MCTPGLFILPFKNPKIEAHTPSKFQLHDNGIDTLAKSRKGKEHDDESAGSYMLKLRYFGRNQVVSQYVETLGCSITEEETEIDVILVDTYDNRSKEYLERLEGTVALMRSALDVLEKEKVRLFIVLTDNSAETGTKRPNVPEHVNQGTRPDGIHGFGALTAEVLGRMAAKKGAITRIVKHSGETDAAACSALRYGLEALNSKKKYEVLRHDI